MLKNSIDRRKFAKTCEACGKEFNAFFTFQKYCSHKCGNTHLYKRKLEGITRKCIVCGNEFQPRGKAQIMCSDECRNVRYKNQCIGCGKTYYSKTKTIYCSRRCRCALLKKDKGPTSPRRKNNKSINKSAKKRAKILTNTVLPEIAQRTGVMRATISNRTLDIWLLGPMPKKLRDAILERDGYKCYICGKTTELHVHHIIRRSQGGEHKPENLITLCSSCHRTIESCSEEVAVLKCVKRALKNIGT
jgi:predicted nucleic acid-binding Zn ribbon protein